MLEVANGDSHPCARITGLEDGLLMGVYFSQIPKGNLTVTKGRRLWEKQGNLLLGHPGGCIGDTAMWESGSGGRGRMDICHLWGLGWQLCSTMVLGSPGGVGSSALGRGQNTLPLKRCTVSTQEGSVEGS